jgi:uncharacterized protein YecE (DUF72 family)
MKIAIGTSGFQYPEWRGKFYPETLSTAKMLAFYAERFCTTESNYSFRRIPSEKTIENWSRGTPPGFRFSLKAPQRITHFAKLRDCAETVEFFWSVVRGLDEKLGAILFQLPPSLEKDVPLLAAFLEELPAGMRAAFEFRHESWFDDEVFATLHQKGAALCTAESSDLATPRVATAPFGYLRLRREDYATSDLTDWARWVREQKWKAAFLYFKHEELAVGPKFAIEMRSLLDCG